MTGPTKTRQHSLMLDEVLVLVESGSFGLPDFQRQFVWGPDQVRRLLATVFMGWPAGLILLMEAPPSEFFAVRPLEGMEERTTGANVRHLILDGQQRVTALSHAFGVSAADGDPQWYLDVEDFEAKFADGDVEESFVRYSSRQASRSKRLLIPLSALRSDYAFETWRAQPRSLLDEESGFRRNVESNRVWTELLAGLRSYRFPTTVLPSNMPLSAVAMIFERLNTSGLRLDTFDLVVAHVYRDGRNLREEWEEELYSRPVLRRFLDDDPLIAAELIAMVKTKDTRRAALLSLEPDTLWSSWTPAVNALEAAASFLVEHAGIDNTEQLPHRGILLALAGAAFELGELAPDLSDLFLFWVLSSGLAERFNAAVNTRVVSEYRGLVAAARGKQQLPALAGSDISLANRRGNSSIWLTFLAMIRRQDPLEYPDGMLAMPLPREWAKPVPLVRGSSSRLDPAFGLILSSPRSGQRLQSERLPQIRADLLFSEPSIASEFIQSQLLPPLTSTSWESDRAFLRARSSLALDVIADLRKLADRAFERARARSEIVIANRGRLPEVVEGWIEDNDPQLPRTDSALATSLRLARTLLSEGRPNDAADTLQLFRDARTSPNERDLALATLFQGRAFTQAGRVNEAELAYKTVINILERAGTDVEEEVRASAVLELSRLLVSESRMKNALPLLTDAIKRIPLSSPSAGTVAVELHLLLAQALMQAGDQFAAAEVARNVIAASSDLQLSTPVDLMERASRLIQQADQHI